uniref:Uncharacterized protein n=1 Tax=Streptomyces sp. NBC_00049 TaxID=2903617 RepID=A0AAU2K0U7_9ACTN
MFWKRLGERVPAADETATGTKGASSVEHVAPVGIAPPEPWDPAAPVARIPVENGGQHPLELILEPYCWSEWLEPGAKVTVVTVGTADAERPWSGTTVPDEPFELQYYADQLVIWPYGDLVLIVDADGNELYRLP